MEQPAFVPEYKKPDAPGIWMNFDNTVSIYHVVGAGDGFEQAAQDVLRWMQQAQERFPNWPRLLYLDIDGHRGEHLGFDQDFYEFQQDFLFATFAHFVTAFDTPLTGPLMNPNAQRNDVPGRLVIAPRPNGTPG